ncbi:MAG: hypothetical protein H0X62_16175 [Bacteroidetes bacterium]|nr:hypothetical protein [Bacteroidota bacterium]
MRAIIIIFIIQVIYTKASFSQDAFDHKLLEMEKEIFSAGQESEKNYLTAQKFMHYLHHGIYSADALKEARRVNCLNLEDSSLQKSHLWNTALLAQMLDEHAISTHYYNLYQKLYPESSIESLLLEFFIHSQFDTVASKETIGALMQHDERFEALTCHNQVLRYQKKKEALYLIFSAIVPGSGNMLLGNGIRGVNSLAINTASGLALYYLISSNMYVNAAFWATGFGLKFYTGNIKLTSITFKEKESKKKNQLAQSCELVFEKIMMDYPLEFK